MAVISRSCVSWYSLRTGGEYATRPDEAMVGRYSPGGGRDPGATVATTVTAMSSAQIVGLSTAQLSALESQQIQAASGK